MIYVQVEYILIELSQMKKEAELFENLKLIAYCCDSNYPDILSNYFRKLIEKVNSISADSNIRYSLYLLRLILLFLSEIKKTQPAIISGTDIFKLITTFFLYVEKVVRKRGRGRIYRERRSEIISIIYQYFRNEFYYRKNKRFLSIQYTLPFRKY